MSILSELERETQINARQTSEILEECQKAERIWEIENEIQQMRNILSEKVVDLSISYKLHKLLAEKEEIFNEFHDENRNTEQLKKI